eukprot:g3862.t1
MKSSFALLSALALATLAAGEEELKIVTEFKPDECEQKTKAGDHLKMHYTGTIDQSSETGDKGSKFDSSRDRGDPFTFQLGAGQVIKGWDEGLLDMCVGEKRTLIIPPSKGYGASGAGGAIPGGATLNFDVELVAIDGAAPPPPNVFKELDADEDKKISKDELKEWFKKQDPERAEDDKFIEEIMNDEDKDKDGFIQWAEFSGPKGEME